jgi:hypothetical protein
MSRNPFSAYQERGQDQRDKLIKTFLNFLKAGRAPAKFENVTQLADLVARHISAEQGEPCAKSTILRNRRYKEQLLLYLVNAKNGSSSLDGRKINDPSAQVLLLQRDLMGENAKREIQRLKSYIKSLEDATSNQGPRTIAPTLACELDATEAKLYATLQALFAIMRHFGPLLRADSDGAKILDATTIPARVVVDAELARPFFDWIDSNRDVGGR